MIAYLVGAPALPDRLADRLDGLSRAERRTTSRLILSLAAAIRARRVAFERARGAPVPIEAPAGFEP